MAEYIQGLPEEITETDHKPMLPNHQQKTAAQHVTPHSKAEDETNEVLSPCSTHQRKGAT